MYIDTHTHFDMVFDTKEVSEEALFNDFEENDIGAALQVSVSTKSFQWSFDFAKRHKDDGILFTLGIHPSSPAWDIELKQLDIFVEKVVKNNPDLLFGIGECGLDYFRMRQPQDVQINSFKHQIYLSKKYKLPLIIHTREAMDDTLRILKESAPVTGIMHCFPGTKKDVIAALDLGFYISYAGNLTYKNAVDLHESARFVPDNRLLLETDAPYLTPVPHRGKKNRPDYVVHTYGFAAQLRNQHPAALCEHIEDNFDSLMAKRFI